MPSQRSIGFGSIGTVTTSGNNCFRDGCLLNLNKMQFTHFNNNNYYNPGNRASWSRRSRSGGGNGFAGQQRNATRIGLNRLGGPPSKTN